MVENCHYINKSEEKNPRKLTSEAKVKKKTPDSDLGKPLLGWPQARRATVEEIEDYFKIESGRETFEVEEQASKVEKNYHIQNADKVKDELTVNE